MNGPMTEERFKLRTNQLALQVIQLVGELPRNREADVIGRQLLRPGTSIGANYRAACRGKSLADVLAKLAIVEEETDETQYWLELLVEADIVRPERIATIWEEANQIVAMTVSSIRTLRRRTPIQNPKSKIQNPI